MSDTKDKGFIEGGGDKVIDINKLISILISRWYVILLAIGISLFISFLYLRYTKPLYQAEFTIKMEDEKPNQLSDFFKFGKVSGKLDNILKTESEILKSTSLNEKALIDLGYTFSFFQKGNILASELYPNKYFDIICHYNDSGKMLKPFTINFIDDRTFDIILKDEKVKFRHHFHDTIFMDNSLIEIREKANSFSGHLKGLNLLCIQNNLHSLAKSLSQGLNIEIVKGTSIIEVSFISEEPQFTADYINTIAKVYNREAVRSKSQSAQQTIDFIDKYLDELSGKVKESEIELSKLESESKSVFLDEVAKKEIERLAELQTQKDILSIKLESLAGILKNVLETKDKTVTLMVFDNEDAESLTELLKLYNELILERISHTQKYTVSSSIMLENEKKTKEVKSSLLKVLEEVKNKTITKQKFIEKLIAESNAVLSNYPLKQKLLMGLKRDFNVNEKVYAYLLEKKLEVEVTKSSIIPNALVIDKADVPFLSVYPKRQKTYILAFLIGLIISLLGIFFVRFFNRKIPDKEAIENVSSTPVIGVIKKVINPIDDEYQIHTFSNPKSVFSESIRGIRTSVNFILQGQIHKVICFTSTVSGEGKTFCSINLGASLTLLNKRVIILGCDLRRPKIHLSFPNLTNDIGITTYLINKNTLSEIIQDSGYENLHVITAGPVPPNPAELLQSPKMLELIESLKNEYDYVLIDTAPVGLVSDSLALMQVADMTLYILRAQYSKIEFAQIPDRISGDNTIKNIYSVLNSYDNNSIVNSSIYKSNGGGYYGGSGYYYYSGYYGKGGYGYSGRNKKYHKSYYSGYYSEGDDETKKKWWKFWG